MTMERFIIEYKNGAIEERIVHPFHKSKVFKELGIGQKERTSTVKCITITRA